MQRLKQLPKKYTAMKTNSVGIALLWMALVSGCLSEEAMGADYEPGTPSTYLFDTGSLSPAALGATELASRSGWAVVPEDNVTHQFRGDTVLLNDRLTVVLRGSGPGVEVYCQTATGPKMHAALLPLTAFGDRPTSLEAVQILENNPGAVMLAATFKASGGVTCELRYRLTAGQSIVEVRAGEGFHRLLVRCPARYVIVPDFFGNDMVFGPEDLARQRLRLPAENFCLGLSDQGSAEVMCVWQSSQQQAAAVPSDPGGPLDEERKTPGAAAFAGWEIQAAKDQSIWVACLDGASLWHQQVLTAEDALAATALDWKPPFAAKWRVDLLQGHGATQSWFFHDPDALTDGQAATDAASADHPCCFEAGRAVVRVPRELQTAPGQASLLVYALDRCRATPLTTFCPIDVLRNTLGVGPCEYILKTEGLATETNPTPDNVMAWVEKQFSRNKQEKAAEEIQELLGQMVTHVGHAQARIERYRSFAREVCELCRQAALDQPGLADVAALRSIGETIERNATAFLTSTPAPAERARQLAAQVMDLTGRKNSGAACEKLGVELRAIGAEEDRTLANCRMAGRWLQQSAAMLAEDDPSQAALAGAVQARAQQMLETK